MCEPVATAEITGKRSCFLFFLSFLFSFFLLKFAERGFHENCDGRGARVPSVHHWCELYVLFRPCLDSLNSVAGALRSASVHSRSAAELSTPPGLRPSPQPAELAGTRGSSESREPEPHSLPQEHGCVALRPAGCSIHTTQPRGSPTRAPLSWSPAAVHWVDSKAAKLRRNERTGTLAQASETRVRDKDSTHTWHRRHPSTAHGSKFRAASHHYAHHVVAEVCLEIRSCRTVGRRMTRKAYPGTMWDKE